MFQKILAPEMRGAAKKLQFIGKLTKKLCISVFKPSQKQKVHNGVNTAVYLLTTIGLAHHHDAIKNDLFNINN